MVHLLQVWIKNITLAWTRAIKHSDRNMVQGNASVDAPTIQRMMLEASLLRHSINSLLWSNGCLDETL